MKDMAEGIANTYQGEGMKIPQILTASNRYPLKLLKKHLQHRTNKTPKISEVDMWRAVYVIFDL